MLQRKRSSETKEPLSCRDRQCFVLSKIDEEAPVETSLLFEPNEPTEGCLQKYTVSTFKIYVKNLGEKKKKAISGHDFQNTRMHPSIQKSVSCIPSLSIHNVMGNVSLSLYHPFFSLKPANAEEIETRRSLRALKH